MRTQKSAANVGTNRCIANAVGYLPYRPAQWQGDLVLTDLAKVQCFPIRSHGASVASHMLLAVDETQPKKVPLSARAS